MEDNSTAGMVNYNCIAGQKPRHRKIEDEFHRFKTISIDPTLSPIKEMGQYIEGK